MKHPIPPTAREQRIGANRMKLPFDNNKRRGGWAAWIFRHRIGLLVTTVVYLSAAILFVTYKIIIIPVASPSIMVEFEAEQRKEEQKPEIEQKQIEQMDYQAGARVHNRASDQNAKYDAAMKDNRPTTQNKVYDDAQRIQDQMRSGREAYERSMQEIAAMGKDASKNDQPSKKGSKDGTASSSRFKGNVAVEYDLPGRTDVYLHHPTYQCQGGGQVVVTITVNRNGKVINAVVDKASSTSDACILEMAVKASLASSFNASPSSPDRQKGTITYTFVPQ